MTSKAGRAAYAIKSGTVAAGMAVSNTLAYVAPQLAGAIDIVVVKQPDGALKSSPFYVRFGKYTGLRSDPNKVKISVNGTDAEFCMHMGRTGEAYFVVDVEPGEHDAYAEVLNDLLSPTSAYSSDQEAMHFSVEQPVATLRSALEESKLRNAASTSALPSCNKEEPSKHIAPGAFSYVDLERTNTMRAELDSTLSAPASLASPAPQKEGSEGLLDDMGGPFSDSGRRLWARNSSKQVADSWSKVRGWKMDLPEQQHQLESRVNDSSKGFDRSASMRGAMPSSSAATQLPCAASPNSNATDGGFTFSPQSSASSSLNIEDGIFTPAKSGRLAAAERGSSRKSPGPPWKSMMTADAKGGGRHPPSTADLSAATSVSAHGSRAKPPQHPWSVGNPRLLPSALAAQPQVMVMSSSEAATPVHGAPAASSAEGTAILPRRSMDEILEAERGRYGNRMELEAIDQKVRHGGEPAPFAMAEAYQEMRNWQHGGPSPNVNTMHKRLAQGIDNVAEMEGSSPSVSPSHQPHTMHAESAGNGLEHFPEDEMMSSSGVGSSCASSPDKHRLCTPVHHQTATSMGAYGLHPSVPDCLTLSAPQYDSAQESAAGDARCEDGPPVPTSPFSGSLVQSHFHRPSESPANGHSSKEKENSHGAKKHAESTLTRESEQSNATKRCRGQWPMAPESRSVNGFRDDAFGSSIDLNSVWCPVENASGMVCGSTGSVGGSSEREELRQERNTDAHRLGINKDLEASTSAPCGGSGRSSGDAQAAGHRPLLDVWSNGGGGIQGPAQAESPVMQPRASGRSPQASTVAASSSLPICIPTTRSTTASERLSCEDRPIGGSLPAGAFGMSPTESAKYLGNTSGGTNERSPLASFGSNIKADANQLPSQQGFDGFELSLCASRLYPGISGEEAWQVFEAARVEREQFEQQGSQLVQSSELVCRLGKVLLPWQQAAPVVLGMLAFGARWDSLASEAAGVRISIPASQPPGGKKEGGKRSSWRVWLGSWRTRRDSKGNLAAAAAAAVANADKAAVEEAWPASLEKQEEKDLSECLDGMMQSGKRIPGKRRAFSPSSQQLSTLRLNQGQNTIDFTYGKQRLRAYLYYFTWNVRLVISDVDGTITRSDLLGHVLPRVGFDWSHPGINRFFSCIEKNGYQILFLSSRAIAQASATRDYLHSLNQDGHRLPSGPVIISPDGLFPSLYRELVLRRPHEFKIRALEDIKALFPPTWNPFFCGLGNRDTDEISYLTVGVPAAKIFIINPKGELRKASSAVVTSTWNSLTRIVDLVNEIFPPYQDQQPLGASPQATPEREEFSDYNFWHVAPPIIVDSEDEAFGDPALKGFGDSEEESTDEEEGLTDSTPVGFRAWP